jgi:ribosomal protein S16
MFPDNAGAEAGWEQQDQLERERYQLTAEALERCLKAGAHPEDVARLARECGIEVKHLKLT